MLAALALGAGPHGADAALTFGSGLTSPPSPNSHPAFHGDFADCNDFDGHPCTLAAVAVHRGSAHPVGAPIPGVVVRFRIRSLTTDSITFRIIREQGTSPSTYRGVGSGPSVALGGTGEVETYAAAPAIPVARGDFVGFDEPVTPIAQTSNCDLRGAWLEFTPLLPNGGTDAASANSTCELLVNADVEPDLDRDGLGDETMDSSVSVPACGYTQTGTSGDDRIEGFPLGDRILGLGGADRLSGIEGRDCLNGGGSADRLSGGPGADRLNGGGGADRLDCGSGADVAIAGPVDHVLANCEEIEPA